MTAKMTSKSNHKNHKEEECLKSSDEIIHFLKEERDQALRQQGKWELRWNQTKEALEEALKRNVQLSSKIQQNRYELIFTRLFILILLFVVGIDFWNRTEEAVVPSTPIVQNFSLLHKKPILSSSSSVSKKHSSSPIHRRVPVLSIQKRRLTAFPVPVKRRVQANKSKGRVEKRPLLTSFFQGGGSLSCPPGLVNRCYRRCLKRSAGRRCLRFSQKVRCGCSRVRTRVRFRWKRLSLLSDIPLRRRRRLIRQLNFLFWKKRFLLRKCYMLTQHRVRAPKSGKVILSWTIGPDGLSSDISVEKDEIGDKNLIRCLENHLHAMRISRNVHYKTQIRQLFYFRREERVFYSFLRKDWRRRFVRRHRRKRCDARHIYRCRRICLKYDFNHQCIRHSSRKRCRCILNPRLLP